MSTIKSSDEHLTLNADGTSKDIKFQANGVEKASISSAGAFTSTTIDATKLTGTIPNFTSTGIDDNATSTAITIASDEKVGIGVTNPTQLLQIKQTGRYTDIGLETTNHKYVVGVDNDTSEWYVYDNDNAAFRMKITSDGRGLSEFTAKAWVNFRGSSTVAINDSHNVSSISDNGTGNYTLNLSNNLGNDHGVMSGYSIMDGLVYGDSSNVSSAGSFRMRTVVGYSNSMMDADEVHCIVFGD